jgi:hypothetical protein
MSLTSVSNSYANQLSMAEKDPSKKLPGPPGSQDNPSSQQPQDSIQLSAAGLAALKSLPEGS